uniref:Uncharacterized protein n=1 Tax=Equus caballus TaxID=9796 RepID=A0A3Q2H8F3_HORSE
MSASKLRSVAAPRGRKTRLSVKADQRKETQVSSPESIACLPQTHRGSQQPTPRLDRLFPGGHRQRGVQPRETRREDSRPAGRQPAAPPPLSFLKCDSPASKKKDSNQKTRRHQAAPCGMVNLPEHKRGEAASPGMTTAPLTLEQAIQTHRVVEAKTARRYWTNYVD